MPHRRRQDRGGSNKAQLLPAVASHLLEAPRRRTPALGGSVHRRAEIGERRSLHATSGRARGPSVVGFARMSAARRPRRGRARPRGLARSPQVRGHEPGRSASPRGHGNAGVGVRPSLPRMPAAADPWRYVLVSAVLPHGSGCGLLPLGPADPPACGHRLETTRELRAHPPQPARAATQMVRLALLSSSEMDAGRQRLNRRARVEALRRALVESR
jgi:hypothetical protein